MFYFNTLILKQIENIYLYFILMKFFLFFFLMCNIFCVKIIVLNLLICCKISIYFVKFILYLQEIY